MKSSPPSTVSELEEVLSRPSPRVIDCMAQLSGDLLLIGAGGKMGPTLARMAKRATAAAKRNCRVIGVSRFTTPGLEAQLQQWGIETISCDLFEEGAVERLPKAHHVLCMLGFKFGTSESASRTWATNTYLPGLISRHFRQSNLVAFSTGNVYPLMDADSRGASEADPVNPVGEYGMSALGRERIFEFFSREDRTPMTLFRLNYACECRYGVLVDIARRVSAGLPVSLQMGRFNVLWQGDANAYALLGLKTTGSPPTVLNMTGPENLSVRDIALEFGKILNKPVRFEGKEGTTALLNDSSLLINRFGPPAVDASELVSWIGSWILAGNPVWEKPTHFEVRDGRF